VRDPARKSLSFPPSAHASTAHLLASLDNARYTGTAGIQTGYECWCSNYKGTHGPPAPSNQCNTICTDAGQKCGGFCRMTEFDMGCPPQDLGITGGLFVFVVCLFVFVCSFIYLRTRLISDFQQSAALAVCVCVCMCVYVCVCVCCRYTAFYPSTSPRPLTLTVRGFLPVFSALCCRNGFCDRGFLLLCCVLDWRSLDQHVQVREARRGRAATSRVLVRNGKALRMPHASTAEEG
jgi:hypothetical protein